MKGSSEKRLKGELGRIRDIVGNISLQPDAYDFEGTLADIGLIADKALAASEQTDLERLREWVEGEHTIVKRWLLENTALRVSLDIRQEAVQEGKLLVGKAILKHIADEFGVGGEDGREGD